MEELRAVRYSATDKRWKHTSRRPNSVRTDFPPGVLSHMIRVVSWNLEFNYAGAKKRHRAALDEIRKWTYVDDELTHKPIPFVILLQEVNRDEFSVILEHPWVRERFNVIPPSPDSWPKGARYGLVSLIERGLPFSRALNMPFQNSSMGRTAMIIDLLLPRVDSDLSSNQPSRADVFRIANVHLESLPNNSRLRREQLVWVSDWVNDTRIMGGLVAGDTNASQAEDEQAVEETQLDDLYKITQEQDVDDDGGNTWWDTVDKTLPPGRLDKFLVSGVDEFIMGELERKAFPKASKKHISDHCAILTTVKVMVQGVNA